MKDSKPAFSRELSQFALEVEHELQTFFEEKLKKAEKLDHIHVQTVQALQEMVLRGGKRIRPYLCFIGYQLADGTDRKKIVKIGAALELLHNYLLNLDDMADRDTVRHGGPTLEISYQRTLFSSLPKPLQTHYSRTWTEIAGAILNTYIYELVRTSGFDAKVIVNILEIIDIHMLEETAVGWQIHMLQNLESLHSSTEERFIKGLTLVTARYTFVGPLLVGLLCGKTNNQLQEIVVKYGEAVGTAFQIHDDILGLFGKTQETGKAVGNDIREGKKTLLMQYAYSHASKTDQDILEKSCGNRDLTQKEIEAVQKIVTNSGALEHSKKLAQTYVEKGLQALATLPSTYASQTTQLIELAHYVILREK
jgi:geranylgeranyl pyrophosphate synthase